MPGLTSLNGKGHTATPTAAPKVTTTDAETFKAGRFRAILQRHYVNGEVRFDVFVDRAGLDLSSCDDGDALLALGGVLARAGAGLNDAQLQQARHR